MKITPLLVIFLALCLSACQQPQSPRASWEYQVISAWHVEDEAGRLEKLGEEAALNWAGMHRSADELLRFQRDLFLQWGELDPEASVRYADANLRGFERNEALKEIIKGWAAQEPAAAAQWAASLDRRLETLLAAVTRQWAQHDPYAAALPDPVRQKLLELAPSPAL